MRVPANRIMSNCELKSFITSMLYYYDNNWLEIVKGYFYPHLEKILSDCVYKFGDENQIYLDLLRSEDSDNIIIVVEFLRELSNSKLNE